MNTLNRNYGLLEPGCIAPKPPKPIEEEKILAQWTINTGTPLVSIICHTYNHQDYIEDALNSFLMQETDFPFEIIVHDDASTDGTAAIITDYVSRYPNIIRPIFQNENQFSKGNKPPKFSFPAAQGKYLSFCEGDDYWLDKSKLDKQVNFLESHPEYSICGHDAIIVEGSTVTSSSKLPKAAKCDCPSEKLRTGHFILTLSATFVNKIAYAPEQANFLNGDLLLFSRLGLLGHYKFMPEIAPGVYRVHRGGVWSLVDKERRKSNQLNSLFWISLYYKHNNNTKLTDEYAFQAAQVALLNTTNFNLAFILKFFMRILRVYAISVRSRILNK